MVISAEIRTGFRGCLRRSAIYPKSGRDDTCDIKLSVIRKSARKSLNETLNGACSAPLGRMAEIRRGPEITLLALLPGVYAA
jgi:hypothetical protein